MPRYHRIKDGVVVNTERAASLPSAEGFTFIQSNIGGPGWLWDGNTLSAPPAPPPAPIPLEEFGRRVKTEGLWDALSDLMHATNARRRIWDEMRTIREPIPVDSAPVRNALSAAGATADQISRIMA